MLSNSLWLSCTAVAALIFFFQWAPLPAGLTLVRHSLAAFAGRHDPAVVVDAVFTVSRR
ncbi:hypothetical protein [Sodalis praecaptivus]|uniref:hypothetical protein n=1 Tax=Sodalis praecaptivus TaxID=1239307 RepID=UPI0035E3D525